MIDCKDRGGSAWRTDIRALLTAVGTCMLATTLAAQTPPDTVPQDSSVVQLEGLTVSTVRTVTTVGGASAVVVAPDSLHLAPAPSLEQALREVPFVTVRENSRGMAEISVRGSESRQVAVLVDGVPLTLGWDHRTDPSIVPLTGVRSMVIVRGLSSILHGPNVLGGVVEVGISQATQPLELERTLQLKTGVDHLGGRALSVTGDAPAQLTTGDLTVRAGVGYRERPGVARAGGVVDSLLPLSDSDLRRNSDLQHADGFFALRYHDLDGPWMGLSASAYRAERGVPPELHVDQPRLWRYPSDSRLLAVLSGGTGQRPTLLGIGDLEASLGINVGSREIESFATPAFEAVEGTESSDDHTVTLRLLGDHSLGMGNLAAAFTYADVNHDEVINETEFNRYRQRLWSLGSEVSWPASEETRLSGGIVLDGADTPESGDKPPLGRLWAWGGRLGASTILADASVRLHASLSSRARFPALRELYSGALGRFIPNPGLRPERLLGGEVGATTERGNVELQGVLFHHRLSDAVVRTSAGGGQFRRANRDEIRSTGVELLAGWNVAGLSILGDLMLQDVTVIDPSIPAGERQPEHMPTLRAGINLSAPLLENTRAFAGAKYTGAQFCVHPDLETNVELDDGLRSDMGVDRTWSLGGGRLRALTTTVALDNVTNAAIYDVCGLPQPGRTLRLSVGLR